MKEATLKVGYGQLMDLERFCELVEGRVDQPSDRIVSKKDSSKILYKMPTYPFRLAKRMAEDDGSCRCFIDAVGDVVSLIRFIGLEKLHLPEDYLVVPTLALEQDDNQPDA
jgi:hypothetical protein